MCGIAGIVASHPEIDGMLSRAREVQLHRGPDFQGEQKMTVGQWTVGLAHQRLSILDLSDAGNQPMSRGGGQSTIIYNGEVYNYLELRDELVLCGYEFTSGSDTEVVLAALEEWGPERAFSRFNGMWALAWVDGKNKRLVLSRDRLGIKPLHYHLSGNTFYFASELKGVLAMASCKFPLNLQVVGEYLLQSLLETSEETFFEGIGKVPPGHYAVVNLSGGDLAPRFVPYWSLPEEETFQDPEETLQEKVREIFIDAVRLRLRSDVPVGVLLSGGVDSSAIAAAMKMILGGSGNLNLLSAVSADPRFDESPFIGIMARHLGCEVNTCMMDFSPREAFELLEQVCWYNDEPVGSFSNIAHSLLMKKAREMGITVVQSGQGADELLCGYRKYFGFYLQYLARGGKLLKTAKTFLEFFAQGTILSQLSLSEAKRYLPPVLFPREIDVRGERLAGYRQVPLGMKGCKTVPERQALDIRRFSVPVLVHYEDRMSMAWSREIRVPFLDYRLVELIAPMAVERKLSRGWTKHIFRKALEPLLPREIVWRKDKQGFSNPEGEWLRNELKEKVTAFFDKDNFVYDKGIVDKARMRSKYYAYCRESLDRGSIFHREIFNVIALELWAKRYSEWIA